MTDTVGGHIPVASAGGPRSGYGRVTKTLHWLTVVALITQFTIGYRWRQMAAVEGVGAGGAGNRDAAVAEAASSRSSVTTRC